MLRRSLDDVETTICAATISLELALRSLLTHYGAGVQQPFLKRAIVLRATAQMKLHARSILVSNILLKITFRILKCLPRHNKCQLHAKQQVAVSL